MGKKADHHGAGEPRSGIGRWPIVSADTHDINVEYENDDAQDNDASYDNIYVGGKEGRSRNDKIRVIYTNARSIVNKMSELKAIAATKNPDIIIITESWTNDTITNDYLHLLGYMLIVRKDRQDTGGGRGGGILAYVKKEIHAWYEESDEFFTQHASLKIKSLRNNISIHIVYRSPNSSRENDDKLGTWIRELRGRYILLGDFNLPDICWQTGSAGRKGEFLFEAAADSFLEQYVEWETHDAGNMLDLR